MASDYIKMVEQRSSKRLNDLDKQQQEAILEAYNEAGRQLAKGFRNSKDGTATKAMYNSYLKKLSEDTESIIQEFGLKGSKVYLDAESRIMKQAFKQAGLDTSAVDKVFKNVVGDLGKQSVKNVIGGNIYKDGAGLSKRIWKASSMAKNSIQGVIAAGLAQDMSAVNLSKLLQTYVNPSARKTWDNNKIKDILGDGYAKWNKNLEYNAFRLARTTLSHTATMSMRQAKKVNPYATKIKWHSVHAAGRTCKTCEEMDGNVYETEKCPFDHPNGMCYQTHEMDKNLNQIADELAAWCNGEENERLDNWWKSIGGKNEDKPKLILNAKYLADNLQYMKENMPKGFTNERYQRFVENLSECPDDYKKMWLKWSEYLEGCGQDGKDSYYSCFERKIYINFKHEIDRARQGDYGDYSTFAHEFGHHVDNMLEDISASKEFLSAVEKDRKHILNNYCKTKIDRDNLKMDLYENYGDCSKGVQDVMGGLKIERFRWGHSESYWNRQNREEESASELFANISAAFMNEDEMDAMEKYFPNSVKEFKKIISKDAKN